MPLVPIAREGGFVLRRGTITGTDTVQGRILAGTPWDVEDAELPSTGIELARVASVARDGNGRLQRWIAVQVRIAAPRAAPDFAFDQTTEALLT